jgi:hypothetical protein
MIDWLQLPDEAALTATEMERVAAKWRPRETTSFAQDVRFFDFQSNGKPFTQVAIVLVPATPLVVNGKRVVVVASEGGHDHGREFIRDDLRREGPGPWLAKRGVTFIALTRIGRWNFIGDDPLGSWRNVPLESRMPVFHRGQKQHWPASEYIVTNAEGVSSPTNSQTCRLPRPGSELEAHMMALTPATAVEGFRHALAHCPEIKDRDQILMLYWGFSTGGAILWPLAKRFTPDGIMGFGMSSFPIAHFNTRGSKGDHRWLYDPSAFRLRERGKTDFAIYTVDLSDAERDDQWAEALHSARFKSFEDTFMFFNVAALSESISRLWHSGILPAETRKRGFSELLRENIDLAFPDDSLSSVCALELGGTRDEIQSPANVGIAASVVRPHCRRHKVVILDGLHHSIAADQVPVFGALWLDAIESGYFDRSR